MSLDYPSAVLRPPFRRAYRLPFRSPAGIDTIIANALADINADDLVGIASVSEIPNSGLGGTGFDYDTPLGTPANGKPHPSGSVVLFGASGDYVESPAADLSSPTTLASAAYITPADLTPSGAGTIVSQWTAAGNEKCFIFELRTDGKLRIFLSNDGSAEANAPSTLAISVAGWVLFIWNDSANKVNYYTALGSRDADPTTLTWSQLGNADLALSSAGINNSAAKFNVGAYTAGVTSRFIGSIGRAIVFTGTNSVSSGVFTSGTLVADMNPADQTNTANVTGSTFTSSTTGEIWTQNGNTPIQNTGHKALASIGSYGLETTAGQDIAIFTRFIVGRFTTAAPGANQVLFDARSNVAKSVSLFSDNANSNKWTLDAGGTPIALSEPYDNDLHVFTVVSNGANSLLRVSGVGEITGNPGGETLDYGTILAALGSGSSAPFSYLRDLTFNSALSGARIAQIEDAFAQTYKGVAV